ncbi:hypothetical protein ACQEU3_32905 [Spirillospora sp. CA-253888]
MSPEATAGRLRSRLAEAGYTVRAETIGGVPTDIGHKRTTHWPTLTSMHLFVAIGRVEDSHAVTAQKYTEAVLDHACANKPGLPRGFQTGVLATAFLVVPTTDQASRATVAEETPLKRFAGMTSTVLVDASADAFYTYRGRRVIGGAYNNVFAREIEKMTSGLLKAGSM